jgi:starch-binding outer membrane protein, SusD/RagB family
MMQMKHEVRRLALAAGVALALPACSDYLEVTNPGPMADESLNVPSAVPGLVTGMSADLSHSTVRLVPLSSVAGDDLRHSGSYTFEGLWNRGILRPEEVNAEWGGMHRARWVAESGLERMRQIQGYDFANNVMTARAFNHAGFANRNLGEHVCFAVIDGSAAQPYTVHFERAEAQFTEAIGVAQRANNAAALNAAYAGRAQVRANLGKWAQAAEDAARVPTNFTHLAVASLNTSRENNYLVTETYNRREFTVHGTRWANVFNDPRVPWDTIKVGNNIQVGQDGRTPFFRQRKYPTLGTGIPLAKGTEMLMIRAEAALRDDNVAQAMQHINQMRAFHSLPALTASTAAEAWPTLQHERGAVLWIEGRRFHDLRRWHAENLLPPAEATWFAGRDKCVPISQNEVNSNPNLRG